MLEVKGLTVGYGQTIVSSIPDFSLFEGQHLLISGPSGCGKTSLLLTLAGLAEPYKGSVQINGQNIHLLKPNDRDQLRGQFMGIVFQTLHLVRSLTVLQNVMLGRFATNQPQDKEEACRLLARMGTQSLDDRLASQLSQGQAQRVALARALMGRPKLLLADEPTSSLDDSATEQVLDLMQELATEMHTALLISSHDARITRRFPHSINLGIVS